ncbi:hypothetical protein [Rossellomorea vietnamensis]|uniref:hypothetical protein n=1 Tax=Rossellomorea vietnamensis TaxID=218284 RepID=UPI003D2DD99A
MKFFFIQIGIFLILAIGLGLISKVLGKNGLYVLLAIGLGAVLFTVFTTTDFGDRTFLYILLFGAISIASVVRFMVKKA